MKRRLGDCEEGSLVLIDDAVVRRVAGKMGDVVVVQVVLDGEGRRYGPCYTRWATSLVTLICPAATQTTHAA